MADGISLAIRDLQAFYGDSHVLHGVTLDVAAGEVVTIIGRNGAGKTTTLRAVMGMIERRTGSISIAGQEVIASPPEKVSGLGVAYVPEERGIYATLDVTENLMLPPKINDLGMPLERIYQLFPNLQDRGRTRGTRLSGGEQQMLAIARVLRTGATLFLLDEPTEGLAPVIVQQIGAAIELMKNEGHTILLVEQNFRFATKIADRHYVMERGRIIDMIPRAEIANRSAQIQQYLGI
ncbi:MAG: ABC transporter ATP-binding protein [Xanthobacteraceae bacterium]